MLDVGEILLASFSAYFTEDEDYLKLIHKTNSFSSILNSKQLIVVVLYKVLAEPVAGLEGLLADAADVGRMVNVLGLHMLNHVTLRSVQSLFTGCLIDCDGY